MNDLIIGLTEKLLNYNRTFLKTYHVVRQNGVKQDFEEVIKPFANEVKKVNDEWDEKMRKWIKEGNYKHLHLKQIDTTHEHIEQMSIQCFFPETSRSRFLNANRTAEFFLLEILREVKK